MEYSPTSFLDRQVNTYGLPRRTSSQQAQQQQQPQTQVPWMPNGQPLPQTQATTAGNPGSVDSQGVYSAGQAPVAPYQQQQIQGFQAPYSPLQGQTQQSLQTLLQNPSTMDSRAIAQLQGQYSDQANLMERQTLGQLGSQLASRGIDTRSGYGLAQQRQLMSDTNRNILNNNRSVQLQAGQQNRQDLMNALGLAGQFDSQLFNQALGGYGANLQGIASNRAEQQTFLDNLMQQFGMNQGMLGQQAATTQQALGRNQQNSQFYSQLGQNQNQFLDNMAFNYQGAQQREQDNLLQYLMQQGGY
jgi:hypothetical protein